MVEIVLSKNKDSRCTAIYILWYYAARPNSARNVFVNVRATVTPTTLAFYNVIHLESGRKGSNVTIDTANFPKNLQIQK